MAIQSKWLNHFHEHKVLFTLLAVGFFLVELEIFALASMNSGRHSVVQVLDHDNSVVYEVKSSKLDSHDKAQFEKTFGPLSNYRVSVITQERPFPLRPWLAAAVGLPVGGVLLFGFFIRAYEALFFRKDRQYKGVSSSSFVDPPAHKLDRLIHRVGRLNIFAIGGFVLLFAVGLWALPHLLSELGRHGVEIIVRYKWVAIGIAAVVLGLVVWIIFLRFLLARKAIETRADVEKYRLQLEKTGNVQASPQLSGPDQTRPSLTQDSSSESSRSDKGEDSST